MSIENLLISSSDGGCELRQDALWVPDDLLLDANGVGRQPIKGRWDER